MFLPFFETLRSAGVPVSACVNTWPSSKAWRRVWSTYDVEAFYYLARTAMVKDERHLDRFDRAFAEAFRGLESISAEQVMEAVDLPRDWLEKLIEKTLSAEEKAQIEALGGFDKLMETLKKRLEEQKGRHQGGCKWIGTGGTSPFGAYGYNPEGRADRAGRKPPPARGQGVGQARVPQSGRYGRAGHPQHQGGLEAAQTLGARRGGRGAGPARHHPGDGGTRLSRRQDAARAAQRGKGHPVLRRRRIDGPAHPRGRGTVLRRPRRVQAPGILLLPQLPLRRPVARQPRRWDRQIPTWDVLRTYGADYKAIFVGDAAMSPYEIVHPGGANEHWNAEAGQVWLARAREQWPATSLAEPAARTLLARTPSRSA